MGDHAQLLKLLKSTGRWDYRWVIVIDSTQARPFPFKEDNPATEEEGLEVWIRPQSEPKETQRNQDVMSPWLEEEFQKVDAKKQEDVSKPEGPVLVEIRRRAGITENREETMHFKGQE
ncbi:hypothetical protein NDU88_005708 [Pleurodeles waltl]|uniref:Uncharacterized protein n=1 Tax=Pleurodeles waltl TaxID=8319 RepID=A0AAV7QLT2_PLEWA|nr:hypothetical protein NDU88_005708 [Pleurodeles waltl]